MIEKYKQIGTLRHMLHALAALFILILPFSRPARILEGWDVVFGGIVPATAPLVFIVIMFDVMMCSIMKSDATDPARIEMLQLTIRWHLALAFSVLALWIFSFRSILVF
ncbi:MAG: hypothetical protein ACFHX7_11240 [Pseudomonadota bacterium]